MRGDGIGVDQPAQILVAEDRDLGDLVRGAEAVEEVQERDAGFQGGRVRDGGEVVCLLDRSGCQERRARLAARHDVGVVAEDRERMGRDCARRDVQTAGGQLARDLVEIRDHQQQALRGREGRGEGARLEGAVDRAGGAALRLHLHDHRDASPDVRPSRRRPLVGELAHRRARRDRVDGDDLAQAMRHRGDRLVAVESLQAGGGGHGSHSSVGAGRHI